MQVDDSDQAELPRLEGRLGAVTHTQLAENARDVVLDGALGDDECVGNLAVRLALRNEAQYLQLSAGEGLDKGFRA